MSNQLDPIKALLSEFISQLEERKLLYERNWPAESLTDIWRKEEAYCWVFADLHYQPFSPDFIGF